MDTHPDSVLLYSVPEKMSVTPEHREAVTSRFCTLIRQELWCRVTLKCLKEDGFGLSSPEFRQEMNKIQHVESLKADAKEWIFRPDNVQEEIPEYPVNPQIELPMVRQVHFLSVEDRLLTLTEEWISAIIHWRDVSGAEWHQVRSSVQSLEMDLANEWDRLFRFPVIPVHQVEQEMLEI